MKRQRGLDPEQLEAGAVEQPDDEFCVEHVMMDRAERRLVACAGPKPSRVSCSGTRARSQSSTNSSSVRGIVLVDPELRVVLDVLERRHRASMVEGVFEMRHDHDEMTRAREDTPPLREREQRVRNVLEGVGGGRRRRGRRRGRPAPSRSRMNRRPRRAVDVVDEGRALRRDAMPDRLAGEVAVVEPRRGVDRGGAGPCARTRPMVHRSRARAVRSRAVCRPRAPRASSRRDSTRPGASCPWNPIVARWMRSWRSVEGQAHYPRPCHIR